MKRICALLLLASALVLSCDNGDNPDPAYRDGALLDVNPHSDTFNRDILPEDYAGLVSAWYFGHST
jgi:hypothetical protein